MNAKINVKRLTENGGLISITMKMADDNGNALDASRIDNVIISDESVVSVTADEIESRYQDVKSHLYQNGAGMHEHQIYRMAVCELVAERVSRKWIIQ